MVTKDIEGKLVRLRIADEQDAAFTLAIRQDNSNVKFMPRLDIDLSMQKQWLKAQRVCEDCYFFVSEKLDGTKIGTFSLYNIQGCTAETGRLVMNGSQIESLETFVLFHDFCFNEAGMHVLYSEIEEGNNAAMGLSLRFGSKEYSRRIDEKTGVSILMMKVMKEDYLRKREKLAGLVDRFASRG